MDNKRIVNADQSLPNYEIGRRVNQENGFATSNISTKNERRYELQQKIDQELRNLQLAEECGNNMEEEKTTPEFPNNDTETLKANGPIVESETSMHPADTQLDNNKLDSSIDAVANHDDISEQSLSQDAFQADAQVEIDTVQASVPQEKKTISNLVSTEADATAVKTGQEPDILVVGEQSRGVTQSSSAELDYVGHSSNMTSPTTTTGTYTLPPLSPGTEEDLADEILPDDQYSFRDQLDRVTSSSSTQDPNVSEISSDVFLGQQGQYADIEIVGNENQANTQPVLDPTLDIPTSPEEEKDGEVTNSGIPEEVQDTKSVEEVSTNEMVHQGDQATEDESKLLREEPVPDNGNINLDLQVVSSEVLVQDNCECQSSSTTDDIKPKSEIDTIQNTEPVATNEIEVRASEIIEQTEDMPSVQSTNTEDMKQQEEYVETIVSGEDTEQEITDSHEEIADRKISTDEDEYSGYDIDICESASYQGDVSIAEENLPEDDIVLGEHQVIEACDSENVPIFADVKYSVGDQITSSEPTTSIENISDSLTDENMKNEHPEIVPWGSDGVLQSTEVENHDKSGESFASDKADTASSGSKETMSSDLEFTYDVEASDKIAEETVSTAIKAAYEIASKMPEDENVTTSVDDVTEDTRSVTPSQLSETTKPENQSAENFAPVNTAGDISENVQKIGESNLEIEGEKSDLSSPHENVQTRENDVTNNAELNEKTTEIEVKTSEPVAVSAIETDTVVNTQSIDSERENLELTKVNKETHDEVVIGASSEKDIEYTKVGNTELEDRVTVDEILESDNPESKELTTQLADEVNHSAEEDKMVKVKESEMSKNPLEKITYNPALSQRNTEATKWFGQSTSEDKIWMKPSGKVDQNAEQERRRLIKSMTRKHNPHLIPKWQPPVEKDPTEDLDERQKSSLKKYEERRRSRTDSSINNETYVKPQSIPPVINETETKSPPPLRENIVIESVVHSKDAIGFWESRLNEKQQKEDLERKRLKVGKEKYQRTRAASDVSRQRSDSTSSTTSNQSVTLPPSENIQRESMKISEVRNRWKNIEKESGKTEPTTHIKKDLSKRSKFSVNANITYRSFQSPVPALAKEQPPRPVVNKPLTIPDYTQSASHKNESFIDREIREAAEREEKWKHEQWEKMSEISVASSEDVFSESSIPPMGNNDPNVVTTVYTGSLPTADLIGQDIKKDSDREESWKTQHNSTPNKNGTGKLEFAPQGNVSKANSISNTSPSTGIASPESLSSYGSSMTSSFLPSPPPLASIAQDKVIRDFGSKSPSEDERQVFESKNLSSVQGKTICVGSEEREEDMQARRQRIKSLTSAVAPRGWEPNKGRSAGPVSPVSPVHRSVPRPEVKRHQTSTSTVSSVKSPTTLNSVVEVPAIEVTNTTFLNTAPSAFDDVTDSKETSVIHEIKAEPSKKAEQEIPPKLTVEASPVKNSYTNETVTNTASELPTKFESENQFEAKNQEEKQSKADYNSPIVDSHEKHGNEMKSVLETNHVEHIEKSTPKKNHEVPNVISNEPHVQKYEINQKEKISGPVVNANLQSAKTEAPQPHYNQQAAKSPEMVTEIHKDEKQKSLHKGGPVSIPKKGGPVFNKKSGPIISSSKSRLEAVMEKEMQEAAAREEEWRRKQMELVNQSSNPANQHIVHSSREIRTPVTSTPPPPVNAGMPSSSMVNLRPKEVKSLFADDEEEKVKPVIQNNASDEVKKRSVVKAVRVPKRKSTLAMRWEEGNFQNNHHEDEN
ncbi:uncharacterized protein LOC120335256 isoform X2 [Styela clava]